MTTEKLPGNWETTPGNRNSNQQYTKFFHNPENDREIRQYSDPDEPHQIIVMDENGYVDYSRTFETEQKAENRLKQIMRKFTDL